MTGRPSGSDHDDAASPGRRPRSDDLSERDWSVLASLDQLRLISADQLERLHFAELTPRSREVVRGRVLRRLQDWRLVVAIGRRVGGPRRGSSRTIYALDSAGVRLLRERQAAEQPGARIRRPGPVGERFIAHTLAVSELAVMLSTGAAAYSAQLDVFQTEPACWWPDGFGGWLKPDAYARIVAGSYLDHWWLEVDRATESLPTIRRKLETYLDFYGRGQLGPGGVMPRVVVTTITEQRRAVIAELVNHLPHPADQLFAPVLDRDLLLALVDSFKE